jgi:RND superfamily putative drug exporter
MVATMLVFQVIVGIPVLFLIPLILFVILMGLGMDYNIFIITRVREELSKGQTDEAAIKKTVERTGGIITICGMIMAGTFGTMMISSLAMLNQFGFALFFSIILDAFVVRIYLMPAILVVGKKYNWWAPGRLQRVKREEFGKAALVDKKVKKGAEEE